jgi:hypothetical protein
MTTLDFARDDDQKALARFARLFARYTVQKSLKTLKRPKGGGSTAQPHGSTVYRAAKPFRWSESTVYGGRGYREVVKEVNRAGPESSRFFEKSRLLQPKFALLFALYAVQKLLQTL